jgi:sialidase-1
MSRFPCKCLCSQALKKVALLCLSISFCLPTHYLSAQTSEKQWLFKNGKDGYNMFRIPTIITTRSGKILAFCEGRRSLRDGGNIDLVMKISRDTGKTWDKLKVVWNEGKNTCGNPAPVYDNVTGDVLVVATLNNDRVFLLRSKDDGDSWENPIEITTSVKRPEWGWYASGPVHAIQLERGFYKNRLVVPCNHTLKGSKRHVAHVIYSDDSGQTWTLGGNVLMQGTDESAVAELVNGNLLLNMRNTQRALPNRKISISKDGGSSWSFPVYDSTLIEPICQGSLLRYSFTPNILLFANPCHKKRRKNLTLLISTNEGKTWEKKVSIYSKKAAYNDLAILPNGNILCIFETGKLWPYSGIAIITLPKSEILE